MAQTGPGGVGNSSTNKLWLDANRLSLTNNDPISSWTDVSGNNNHAIQATGGFQPLFKTAQLNGMPAVEFDGTDDRLGLTNHLQDSGITIFFVYNGSKLATNYVLSFENHQFSYSANTFRAEYADGNKGIIKPIGSYSILSTRTGNSLTSGTIDIINGTNSRSLARTSAYSNPSLTTVGGYYINSTMSHGYFYQGQQAELILYNTQLNSASRKIVGNYLAAKYNLTPEQSLYAYGSTHGNQVMGIGQESDGSNTSARSTDSLIIDNASSLDNGDYVMIGNDNGSYATSMSVPTGIVERWTKVWRADITGTPGTIDVEFFLNAGGFSSTSNYVVLIESADGDFSNGGTSIHSTGRSYTMGTNSIKFTGLTLSDGDYFTLAEQESGISAISNGNWSTPGTWSCTCIPGATDIVTIGNTFNVTVTANAAVLDLTIESGGTLTFSGSDTLATNGTLANSGTITAGSGTISAVGTNSQVYTNGSGSTVSLNNLYVNNSFGLDITSGNWSLSGSLRVSSGTLDVSSATSFTLTSNASTTSQILESIDNAFIGNFTVQRFISTRNANFANLAAPTEGATVADLDDDIFLSGVGGVNGDAGTFKSVYRFDKDTDAHVAITSTATSLTSGIGYEVYLATTSTTFTQDTIDYIGIPHAGPLTSTIVNNGYNLVGNPYHSYISWDAVEKHPATRGLGYVFNSSNGTYDVFNTGSAYNIAPGQGFWIYSVGGNVPLRFAENDKVSSTSSTFLRKKKDDRFNLEILSTSNDFKHSLKLNFDMNATESVDEQDAFYLQSPIETAPAIYTKANNSSQGIVLNSLSPLKKSYNLPIYIHAGENDKYEIKANELADISTNYECVYLKDNKTNTSIDLTVDQKYSFEEEVGTHQRFNLIMSNSFKECNELLNGQSVQKIDNNTLSLRNANGQWYLDYTLLNEELSNFEIRIYNMAGQEVRPPYIFSASYSGNRLINQLNQLNGIFLIQVKSDNGIINKTIKL